MRTRSQLASVVFATLVSTAAASASVEVLSISSDAWLRSGPSTSNERIVGLPRGTAVLELADLETVLKAPSDRWVYVHVLEGRAAGRRGWVWGDFVTCCEAHEWLE